MLKIAPRSPLLETLGEISLTVLEEIGWLFLSATTELFLPLSYSAGAAVGGREVGESGEDTKMKSKGIVFQEFGV